ncbi:MAG: protein kinase [Verrucomicrobia bacterium]|nr:protein kinase [Verrucomicrobiota bacterium]
MSECSKNTDQPIMPAERTCEECGAELPANAPQGLCPRCLVSMGISLVPPAAAKIEPRTANAESERRRQFGDYELLEEIARGGMGIVYRVRQVSLNRIVAMKVLLFGKFASDEFVQRFETEAQAVASLQHPNIIAIHEVGEHEGQHYFSMDYVDGKSLAELVRDNPLPARRAAGYIKIIAGAVQYAHQRGILHRDLKPSNVLIDPLDQPRITDFGLAKRLQGDSELTSTGQVLGSPSYMPPEQADPKHIGVGPASDVYSLGAILYHLLTGRAPFLSETLEDTLRQLLHNEPVSPRGLNASVPRDLETICLKCLEKHPRARYESAQALADELGRYLRGVPIQTRPANAAERIWRWCQRQPAVASLLAGLLLAFTLGFVGVSLEWRRAETQRHLAETFRYAEAMNLALRDANNGNWRQALNLIQEQRPKPGGTDLRRFEWRHLWRRCRGDYPLALPRQDQIVGDLMFSPGGKLLASFAWDNTFKIWDLDSPRTPLLIVTNASTLGGFSADGATFVIGQRDGTIKQYRVGTGEVNTCATNAGELVGVAANGNIVVASEQNHLLNVWDLAKQQRIFHLPDAVPRRLDYGWASGVALASSGNVLAVVEQSKNPLHPDPGVRLWNVPGGKELKYLLMNREIRSLQFSSDGKVLAVGDGDGTIWFWDMATFQSQKIQAHNPPVLALAFSADGQTLASGSSDETIKLWDLATQRQKERAFRGQIGAVWSLAFSPDGLRLASGSRDSTIKIWNVKEEATREVATNLFSKEWGNFTFSPDSKLIAAGCKDRTVRVWDVESLEEKAVLRDAAFAVAFSRNAKTLLVSTLNEIPEWWEVGTKTTKRLPAYSGRIEGNVPCVDISADRRTAALGFNNGTIQLLDIESGRQLAAFHAHDGGVASVAFSPSGDKLISGGRDKSVAVWDARTQTKLRSSGEHRGSVCAVAVSPNGKTLASGCNANTIKFWNSADMSKSLASMSYHQSGIRTLCFAPDGETLASGSEDNTVKLWSVASHLEVASFPVDDHVRLVAFSPDGNYLAVVTDNGTLRLIRAVSLEQADLEAEAIMR